MAEYDTYSDEAYAAGMLAYGKEPEFDALMQCAEEDGFGLHWELACEYFAARNRGDDPQRAKWCAHVEWDC